MDSDQTLSGSTLFFEEASNILQQKTKAYDLFCVICALRANKCEFNFYMVTNFMKCTHACVTQTNN